ncbi:hypothetical protein JGH11_07410 [Dysgonomonas sp. Marseille-P4677]|uniref:hypothetical protein n=1 Tax=Dysgonomonas sp. Marseille-P4677 TaxID=2364790 RepID=UPI001912C8C7|nr:hypothetical protein [Dysgonomonas sp. Marseille-P4677]MBK5720697.1 hypothetical protein [Dysgonomonas sp. Marseille-P4677]
MKDQKALLLRCLKNDVPAMVFSGNDILFLPLLKRYYTDAKEAGCTQEFLDDIKLRIEEFEKHIEMSPDTIKLPD